MTDDEGSWGCHYQSWRVLEGVGVGVGVGVKGGRGGVMSSSGRAP